MSGPFSYRIDVYAKTPKVLGATKVELDPRILLIGNFSGSRETNLAEAQPVVLTASNFDQVVEDMQITVTTEVKEVLSGKDNQKLPVSVTLQGRPESWPRQLVDQVGALNKLQDALDGLGIIRQRLLVDKKAAALLKQELLGANLADKKKFLQAAVK